MAQRNNHQHDYLLRGLISCAQCQLAWSARTQAIYSYYLCTGRGNPRRQAEQRQCTTRSIRAEILDELVWLVAHVPRVGRRTLKPLNNNPA